MGATLLPAQAVLVHAQCAKDIVYTDPVDAMKIISHFNPTGKVMDPCYGDGAFLKNLPRDVEALGCEIEDGTDFFKWAQRVDWVIGNPPYSNLLGWFRHAFGISDNVCFLVPLHRVMASEAFIGDVNRYGGLAEILVMGTGTRLGFPFGYCAAAVHYKRDYNGSTKWSDVRQ